ncbi:MAG: hypothetical protein ACJ8F1_23995 [Polyangia bacterium]
MRHHQIWMATGALTVAGLLAGACSSDNAGPPLASGSGGAGGLLTAAGGAAGASPTACPTSTGPVDPTAAIDDMEATDPGILMIGGRNGSWWAGGDMVSPGANIVPDGNASAEPIPGGGRCGSLHAMHVTGQGFTSWAVLTTSLRYGPVDGGASGLLPYDAHAWTGITFWARIGDTSADQVRLSISDKATRPEGGICDATVSSGSTACYDNFGVALTQLGTQWTQYRIPFAGLGQQHFGVQEAALDTAEIYTVDFNFFVNEIFDLWVDDISFY